jgi:hypothetical protein
VASPSLPNPSAQAALDDTSGHAAALDPPAQTFINQLSRPLENLLMPQVALPRRRRRQPALPWTSTLGLAFFHRQGVDLAVLDDPITEEEVWATIKSLPADRAPGPDDFLAAIIILQQGDARKLWLLNSAYLTLIPKKADAVLAKDFRPISLIHSFAKLIAKILANRLAPLLSSLVATNQSAFVCGRCIHDNYMLVQQTIKSLHKHKVPSLFLKLDISKAFDSVSWSFLLEILAHLGFGHGWCNLLSDLLRTASTRVLLNGEPGDEIRHQRGLCLGDPLSQMLFILVMDVLNSISTLYYIYYIIHQL